MKRKRPKPPTSVEDEELIATVSESLNRAFALRDADELTRIIYERSVESGEPISSEILQAVKKWSNDGASSKLLKAVPLIRKAKKQDKTIKDVNLRRRRDAETKYQMYRDIAEKLIADNPHLRQASSHLLAQKVGTALRKQGTAVSARTIRRALSPKK